MNSKLFNIFFTLILIIVILFTYYGLIFTYFEQDEWAGFAHIIVLKGMNFPENIKTFFSFSGILSHFVPVTSFFSILQYNFFGTEYLFYVITSIFLHWINSILLFFVLLKITKIRLISICITLLFAINKLSSQSVTWIASSLADQLSLGFFLLSILLFIFYLHNTKKKYLFFSLVLFIFSFLSKENTITLFLIYPFIFLLKNNFKVKLQHKIQFFSSFYYLYAILVFFILKFFILIVNPYKHQAMIGSSFSFPQLLLFRLIQYPLQVFIQIFDMNGFIFTVSRLFLKAEYPFISSHPLAPVIIETVMADTISLILSIGVISILLILFVVIYKFNKKNAKFIIGCCVLYFFSLLPYMPLPKFSTFMEPRYYYVPSIFIFLIIMLILYNFFILFNKIVTTGLLLLTTLFIVFSNSFVIQGYIAGKIHLAKQRKEILIQVKSLLPHLSNKKNIFYITGNGSDYLITNNKVPFQSGFGNILMVLYYNPKFLNYKMLDDGFLYQLGEQKYREIDGYGFGYFSDYYTLKDFIESNPSLKQNIHAYYWNEKKQKLIDISNAIKNEL